MAAKVNAVSVEIGQTLGHYRIVEKIGAGGMGEVYRAHDEGLGRDVAVKVLNEAVAKDPAHLARFEREARAAAALDHPHILAIHELGTHGNRPFIVTELLEGETLRGAIQEGGLTVGQAAAYAQQIADGLAAAHERGVTHRDLKPENVFLTTDGRVKILDFGLAKLDRSRAQGIDAAETPTEALPTDAGTVMGTSGYMSPEQVRGERADTLSDIFAMGVILYEMLTGTRPFAGRTTAEIAASILKDDPPPIATRSTKVMPALEAVVTRCLQKRPKDRFQSARDLVFALRAATHERRESPDDRVASQTVRSIAVLPFDIPSGSEDLEYLGDGLTEGIIAKLCGLSGIDRVLARHSVMRFKGTSIDPPAIGKELQVDAVLVGEVGSRGDELLITVELVGSSRGDRIWGNRFSRPLSEIIDVEDAISQAIAEKLHLKLTEVDRARIVKRSTDDSEAYRLYLKGRHLWNRRSREALERSIELYREAITLDERFALAYTGIADSWMSLAWNDFIPRHAAFKEALSASLTALEIDESVAESHVSLGGVLMYLGTDWTRAEKEYRRALEINRNYAEAYHQCAHLLAFTGRTVEGVEMIRRAVELEPASRIVYSCSGQILYFAQRYDDAAVQLRTAIELDPGHAGPYSWLGMVYAQMGECERAERAFERGLEAGTFVTRCAGALGYCYGIHGYRDRALAQLERLSELSSETFVDACFESWIHIGLSDHDSALAALDKAFGQNANWLVALKVDPFFAELRTDTRFQELLRRMDFPRN